MIAKVRKAWFYDMFLLLKKNSKISEISTEFEFSTKTLPTVIRFYQRPTAAAFKSKLLKVCGIVCLPNTS